MYLQIRKKELPLHCVFHGIRFKVNKRLEYSGTPFFISNSPKDVLIIHFYPHTLIYIKHKFQIADKQSDEA